MLHDPPKPFVAAFHLMNYGTARLCFDDTGCNSGEWSKVRARSKSRAREADVDIGAHTNYFQLVIIHERNTQIAPFKIRR